MENNRQNAASFAELNRTSMLELADALANDVLEGRVTGLVLLAVRTDGELTVRQLGPSIVEALGMCQVAGTMLMRQILDSDRAKK